MTGLPLYLVMRRHNRKRSGVNSGLKWRKEKLIQGKTGNIGRSGVQTVNRLAAPDEMLGAGNHILQGVLVSFLQSFNHGGAHYANQIRVFAEGFSRAAPTSVAGDIHIGRKGPVHTKSAHFLCRFFTYRFNPLRIPRRGQSERRRVNGCAVDQSIPMNGVNSDEQGNLQPAFLGDGLQMIGFFCREHMQKRPDFTFFNHFGYVGYA